MSTCHSHPVFSIFQLGSHALRNRAVVAPMSRVSAGPAGCPTPLMADYYTAFAKGGFGMIITEGIYTDTVASQGYHGQPGLVNGAQAAAWKTVTGQVKAQGAMIVAQLMHAGALSQYHAHTLAPSAVQPGGRMMPQFGGEGPFPLPQAMSADDIRLAQQGFVQAARLAYEAGFDGIEIHGANGYLADQFLTPHTNLREDRYGGSIANRCRFITEIIAGIRQVTPAGFVTGLRLSEGKVNHLGYRWPNGAATATALLQEVKNAGPDYIHIAVQSGQWEQDARYSNGASLPGLARAITGKPVIANGSMHQPALAARVLNEGHADLLSIGRAALADPQWVRRTQQGLPVRPFNRNMIWPTAAIQEVSL